MDARVRLVNIERLKANDDISEFLRDGSRPDKYSRRQDKTLQEARLPLFKKASWNA